VLAMPSADFDRNASDDQILRQVNFPDIEGMTDAEKTKVADEFREHADEEVLRQAGIPEDKLAGMSAQDKKSAADEFRGATRVGEGPVFPEFTELGADADEPTPSYAPPRANPQRRVAWGQLLLLGCIIAGGAYWLSRPSPVNKAELPAPPGWDDLAPCAVLTSLDEMQEMTLSDDQRAEFLDLSTLQDGDDPKSRMVVGAWSYDEGSKRYAITLNGQTTTYTLLARGDPTTCILFKGDIHAADLSASWFSFPSNDEPPDDDRERPDPY
jgi:hypothetical protein